MRTGTFFTPMIMRIGKPINSDNGSLIDNRSLVDNGTLILNEYQMRS